VYPQSCRALALLLRFEDVRGLAAQASAVSPVCIDRSLPDGIGPSPSMGRVKRGSVVVLYWRLLQWSICGESSSVIKGR
jgi:hypothetical protein